MSGIISHSFNAYSIATFEPDQIHRIKVDGICAASRPVLLNWHPDAGDVLELFNEDDLNALADPEEIDNDADNSALLHLVELSDLEIDSD